VTDASVMRGRRPSSRLRIPHALFIGKEVERRMQDGEDIALLESKLIEYSNKRCLTAEQLEQANKFSLDTLQGASGLNRHTIIKARSGMKVHKRTREILIEVMTSLNTFG
jgi:hypothetical protein